MKYSTILALAAIISVGAADAASAKNTNKNTDPDRIETQSGNRERNTDMNIREESNWKYKRGATTTQEFLELHQQFNADHRNEGGQPYTQFGIDRRDNRF